MLNVLDLILPNEILEHFIVINLMIGPKEVNLYLDKWPDVPDENKDEKLISNGFLPEAVIQDFPLRNKL